MGSPPPPRHGAIRNFFHPLNADLLLSHSLRLAAKILFFKKQSRQHIRREPSFPVIELENADLDHLQMQHNSLSVTLQQDPHYIHSGLRLYGFSEG